MLYHPIQRFRLQPSWLETDQTWRLIHLLFLQLLFPFDIVLQRVFCVHLQTHILFDFFGTLVTYSESRVEQGYSQSYEILIENGLSFTYQTFLTEWDRLFDEFEQQSTLSHNEFSMTEICECFMRHIYRAHEFKELRTTRDIKKEEEVSDVAPKSDLLKAFLDEKQDELLEASDK